MIPHPRFLPHARPGRPLALACLLACLAIQPGFAQESRPAPTPIRWYHGLAAVAGYGLLVTVDDELQDFFRDNRSETADDIAGIARRVGQVEVYATTGLGITFIGLVAGDREIRDAGVRVSSSMALTGTLVLAAKYIAGRSRPSREGSDAWDFNPFSGETSAPSGHSAMAFALATSLSDEIGNGWATAGLYAFAAGTAWSRVNDDVHWVSDVLAGATLGIVTAKFISGKVSLFGINPPRLRPVPAAGVALTWGGSF